MRITQITLRNYRAFYGEHTFDLTSAGKNLMVYGENGSGKSSLFIALRNFFLASVGKVEVVENIFVPNSQKDTAAIKIDIKESAQSNKTTRFELNIKDQELISNDKVIIADANKIKGFFDYRSLLKTHIGYEKDVNLFKILVEEVLRHALNPVTKQEIGKEWEQITYSILHDRKTANTKTTIQDYVGKFNVGFQAILQGVEKDVNLFMNYFMPNIQIKFVFEALQYTEGYAYMGSEVKLDIIFNNKPIPSHQNFLNEARLSALAISIYLASVRANPLSGVLKVLVLDDLLIGLDMSNRLPLLDILKKYFVEVPENEAFQVVMTTYDRVWFELVNNYFGVEQWKYVEIYAKRLRDDDFEIPIIRDTQSYLERARYYLSEKDNKACAVYLRTEFERLLKGICEFGQLQVLYHSKSKDFTTEDFWLAIVEQVASLDSELRKKVEIHRSVVMNPFSHYDLEKPEFTKELEDTILVLEELQTFSRTIKTAKKITFGTLRNQITKLEEELAKKDEAIAQMHETLKKKDK